MTDLEAIVLIEQWTKKGWTFDLHATRGRWVCEVRGKGLAQAGAGAATLRMAVRKAIAQARQMEDDPHAVIKKHGPAIETLAKKCFGEQAFLGLEPVEWEQDETLKIAIMIRPGTDVPAYVDKETRFLTEAMKLFPNDVFQALTFEVDWPDESTSRKDR